MVGGVAGGGRRGGDACGSVARDALGGVVVNLEQLIEQLANTLLRW